MNELNATVESLAHDGRGVVRHAGVVYFVDGALPGEQIIFIAQRRYRSYRTGRLVRIVEPAAERVTPRCAVFGTCGGCALQHLDPHAQLVNKQQIAADNLRRLGQVQPAEWLPSLAGPVWGYRRKARLGVRRVPSKGGVLVGFRERHKNYITSLDRCDTLDPRLAHLLPGLHALIETLSCPARIPQIEVAAGDARVSLVIRHLEPFTAADRIAWQTFASHNAVQIYLQAGGPNSVEPLSPAIPEPLDYALPEFDLRLAFEPTDFVQVNAGINQRLVSLAISLLAPQPSETVLDLFCGLGNFTLPLARHAARVVGLEGDSGLLQRARDNARRNDLHNVAFAAADLFNPAQLANLDRGPYQKMLLDPPRCGAAEVINALVPAVQPQRIVYVSCNPATLARDAQSLVGAHGYRCSAAGVIDMFPHTAHIESIAVFDA